jgi:arsenite methyltransferase
MSTIHTHLDSHELTRHVQALYAKVVLHPQAGYHFPVGRQLAERLGYPSGLLDLIPGDARRTAGGAAGPR